MSEPNPAHTKKERKKERTQWAGNLKIGKQWDFLLTPHPNNKLWIPAGAKKVNGWMTKGHGEQGVSTCVFWPFSELMRSNQAHGSEAQFKYCLMHALRAMHSLTVRREQATCIMQSTEEMNLSVSAFNHHWRLLCPYLNLSFIAYSNYWDHSYHRWDLSLHESKYQFWS